MGQEYVRQMQRAAEARGAEVRTGHAVESVFVNGEGAVVGVAARTPAGEVCVRARQGVAFCSGGFSHNAELFRLHFGGLLLPGCSVHTNEGDFVEIAKRLGAPLLHMEAAYMAPIALERSLRKDPDIHGAFSTPGDSIVLVNRHGVRVVNEKTTYNDRASAHLAFDVQRAEYGNFLLFAVWDRRNAELFATLDGGGYIPEADGDWSDVVSGNTLEELAAALAARLGSLGRDAHSVQLAAGFVPALRSTIERFNGFARSGVDADFGRGEAPIDKVFHGPVKDNEFPNGCMHPIADSGPFYAIILGPSAIETKGGPRANPQGQILGGDGEPIPGLYGVGNCVASPSGRAYFSAGSTFGPIVTFAYLAAQSLAAEARRDA
jgi:succinate dehydrogenase/fumarate reductase flavoprotein subunit